MTSLVTPGELDTGDRHPGSPFTSSADRSKSRGATARPLLAVLANPTLSPKSRSAERVRLAARILGSEQVRIANLFALPSASSKEIGVLGYEAQGWELARIDLGEAIADTDQVLLGFGTIPVGGAARRHLEEQLQWLAERLRAHGKESVWQVGQARHPSRWHQYVSDRHRRTSGGSFEVRLREVLTYTDLDTLPWAPRRARKAVERA